MLEMKTFLEEAKELEAELVACRRTLHQMPELGMELPRTTAQVCQELEGMGCEPQRLAGGVTA